MIAAAITWAVLATCGAVAVYVLMRRECVALDSAGYDWWVKFVDAEVERANAQASAEMWVGAYDRQAERVRAAEARAIDAEDRLRQIEQSRHLSAKHARQVQLQRQRQAVLEKAGELVA